MSLKAQFKQQLVDNKLSSNELIFRNFIVGFIIILAIIYTGAWIKNIIVGG